MKPGGRQAIVTGLVILTVIWTALILALASDLPHVAYLPGLLFIVEIVKGNRSVPSLTLLLFAGVFVSGGLAVARVLTPLMFAIGEVTLGSVALWFSLADKLTDNVRANLLLFAGAVITLSKGLAEIYKNVPARRETHGRQDRPWCGGVLSDAANDQAGNDEGHSRRPDPPVESRP